MSGDLRAKVEEPRTEAGQALLAEYPSAGLLTAILAIENEAALIPWGAVLVTEETLAAALDDWWPERMTDWQRDAADILRHLREGT